MGMVIEALVVLHNEVAGVPSSDVELNLNLVPVMVFTEAVRPSRLDIEILPLHYLFNGKVPCTIGTLDLHHCCGAHQTIR
jgi:hypothetical protein